jgi:hypothetical protein
VRLYGKLSRSTVLGGVAACIVLVSACGGDPQDKRFENDRAENSSSQVEPPVGVRVVAAGDIACAAGEPVTKSACQQEATAELAKSLDPELVLTLGDTQYPDSSLPQLMASYDKTWGALLERTRPTIGNHEYRTPGAKGYYTYFQDRQPGPPGYYRLNIGGWKITVLNSNCTKVSCAEQAAWMDRKMKAYPAKCSIVTMHHPRYSSGSEHGNNTAVKPLWAVAYKHRNDIVLSGHDHDYEWFTRMDGLGHFLGNGMQSFVVGTGGKDLYQLGTRKPGSRYFQRSQHGVLALDLRPGSFGWKFHAIDGTVLDEGARPCV